MGDDWMNHRMVCYIERDVFVSIEESKIIERFQGYCSRKGLYLVLEVSFHFFASIMNYLMLLMYVLMNDQHLIFQGLTSSTTEDEVMGGSTS
jgi:hypothetical protein